MNKLLVFISVLISLSVVADSEVINFIICRNGTAIRTIRSQKDPASGVCSIVYTKAGIDQVVGNAKNLKSCVDIGKKIQVRLDESKQWKCREVKKATVYESTTF